MADREDGKTGQDPTAASSPPADVEAELRELRELRKRTWQLEQRNEILRRATAYFSRDVLLK